MIFELIAKDFKLSQEYVIKGKLNRILGIIGKLIFLALVVALISFMTNSLDKKIVKYSPNYGSIDFLVLVLFIYFIFNVFQAIVFGRKMVYNNIDNLILNTLPISNDSIIVSKMINVYLRLAIDGIFIISPMLITYGITRASVAYYYIFSLIYPFLISLTSLGLGFIFVSLYEYIYRFLKNKDIVQFILASLLVIGLCYCYQYFLALFLNALEDSSIGEVFSSDFIETIHSLGTYLIPVSNIIYPLFGKGNVLAYALLFSGFSILMPFLGYFVTCLTYSKLSKIDSISFNQLSTKQKKLTGETYALVKKEFNLIFRNSSSTFSYTSLLIMLPFLTYVVISALNNIIFSNMSIIVGMFPNLANYVNLSLVLLFIGAINTSSSNSILNEGMNMNTIKLLPITPFKMIMIKISVPLTLSFISLLVSDAVLVLTNCIDIYLFLYILVSGIILLVVTSFLNIMYQLHDKCSYRFRLTNLTNLIYLGLPILMLAINMILEFLRMKIYYSYLVNGIVFIALLAYTFINYKKRIVRYFKEMEVKNL